MFIRCILEVLKSGEMFWMCMWVHVCRCVCVCTWDDICMYMERPEVDSTCFLDHSGLHLLRLSLSLSLEFTNWTSLAIQLVHGPLPIFCIGIAGILLHPAGFHVDGGDLNSITHSVVRCFIHSPWALRNTFNKLSSKFLIMISKGKSAFGWRNLEYSDKNSTI